ncbi:HK97 gp10 family phage protein [Streptomyces qinglanensis]|uniref:Bacteriophage HK97-gp10, putative tail-component n=1 Tax=Streptomyces qinglanensis TaxID=943816 RepID=A0A1H9U259_9ACTN|nr:HK97 gp10 family phage protein [Streptomyces qinglanensis]SES03321.1 Bacteriophage HK97-gp10, putative tail-component [Streptomyces qinglanensis]
MAAKFRMSRKGVGQLLRSPMVEAEMLRRADVIKDAAVAISPVGTAAWDPHPGLYKASWHSTSTRRGGRRKDRAVATVWNSAPYARWVEYGTERVHAHHVLLRAAQAGGR